MTTALAEHAKTVYQTRYAEPDTEECMTNAQARIYYQGFLGARTLWQHHTSHWFSLSTAPSLLSRGRRVSFRPAWARTLLNEWFDL